MCGCLSLYVTTVMKWERIQGAPHLHVIDAGIGIGSTAGLFLLPLVYLLVLILNTNSSKAQETMAGMQQLATLTYCSGKK